MSLLNIYVCYCFHSLSVTNNSFPLIASFEINSNKSYLKMLIYKMSQNKTLVGDSVNWDLVWLFFKFDKYWLIISFIIVLWFRVSCLIISLWIPYSELRSVLFIRNNWFNTFLIYPLESYEFFFDIDSNLEKEHIRED